MALRSQEERLAMNNSFEGRRGLAPHGDANAMGRSVSDERGGGERAFRFVAHEDVLTVKPCAVANLRRCEILRQTQALVLKE
jgi:hypothetical protein